MSDLGEIIARLEKAEAPGRSLDRDIFRAIGLTPKQERHCADWCRMDGRTDLTRERYIEAWAPEFTRSVDAALTLAPSGWRWYVGSHCFARLESPDFDDLVWHAGGQDTREILAGSEHCAENAASPAIALCIAALKARQSLGVEGKSK